MKMRHEIKGPDLQKCVDLLPRGLGDCLTAHGDDLVVAGGFVRSVAASESVADVDVFVRSRELVEECVEHLRGAWQGARGASRKPGRVTVHHSTNATTVRFVDGESILPVQFCDRWTFDEASELLANFDFTVCKAALWHDGEKWCSLADPTFYAHVTEKRLCYCSPEREEAPGDALLRVLKFYRRGYRIGLFDLGKVVARLADHNLDADELARRLRTADRGSDVDQAPFFHT